MLAHVIVSVKGMLTQFICKMHRSDSEHDRLMSREFYEKNCAEGTIPQGPHHELELIGPRLHDHAHASVIHYHQDPRSNMTFVCWTGSLPTVDEARTLFRMWCIGTAYTMATGTDFVPLVTNPESFEQQMRDEYGVSVTGSGIRP